MKTSLTALVIALGIFAAAFAGVALEGWLARRRQRRTGKHPARPARRRVPGRPVDGWPLDDRERRILGRVEMDALIDVPEPDYTGRRQP